MPRRAARRVGAGLLVTAAATLAASCSDDGDADRPIDTLPPIDTQLPVVGDVTEPPVTRPSTEDEFIESIVADDEVTAEELDAAYQAYIRCLADGGGSGRYAYDIELRIPLTLDWTIDPDESGGLTANGLAATCARDFLDDLVDRFEAGSPPPDDLAARQLDNLAACVTRFSPDAAAALPDAVTLDTTGTLPLIDDLQLGRLTDGANPDIDVPVARCVESRGAAWREF